jgi:hypothetical protein
MSKQKDGAHCKRKSLNEVFQPKGKKLSTSTRTDLFREKLFIVKPLPDIELIFVQKDANPDQDGFAWALQQDINAPLGTMNRSRRWGFILRADRRISRQENSPAVSPARRNQERQYNRSYFVRALNGQESTPATRLQLLQDIKTVSYH